MARARNIKPGFFKNEDLAECSLAARLCFAGLWTLADREGRLEDRAKRIKGELFAYDNFDVEPLLIELEQRNFLERYEVDGQRFIQISKFSAHQTPHYSEKPSVIKPPRFQESAPHEDGGDSEKTPGALQEDSGSEAVLKRGSQPPDSLIPDSLIPDSPNPGSATTVPSPPPSAPAPPPVEEDPPEANGATPTAYGLASRAMRQQGMSDATPSDPRLRALVDQGVTPQELGDMAKEAVEKGRGSAWAYAAIVGRREQAAALRVAPAAPPTTQPGTVAAQQTDAYLQAQKLSSAEKAAGIEAARRIREQRGLAKDRA